MYDKMGANTALASGQKIESQPLRRLRIINMILYCDVTRVLLPVSDEDGNLEVERHVFGLDLS